MILLTCSAGMLPLSFLVPPQTLQAAAQDPAARAPRLLPHTRQEMGLHRGCNHGLFLLVINSHSTDRHSTDTTDPTHLCDTAHVPVYCALLLLLLLTALTPRLQSVNALRFGE